MPTDTAPSESSACDHAVLSEGSACRSERTVLLHKFASFCVVGSSGVIIDSCALFLLADPATLHINQVAAKILAAEVAMLSNFHWNNRFTFQVKNVQNRGKAYWFRFIKYNVVSTGGLILSLFTLHYCRQLGINLYLSNLIAIGSATAWNFTGSLLFTWKARGVETFRG